MTTTPIAFPTLVQEFFQRRLVAERRVSDHTVASYRDTFELMLGFAQQHTGRTPSALTLEDLDAPLLLAFLDYLENERGNSATMHLLQSGVDINVIALWLGHEDPSTTHLYVEADLAMKEAALKRLDELVSKPVRFKARDRLLDFLQVP